MGSSPCVPAFERWPPISNVRNLPHELVMSGCTHHDVMLRLHVCSRAPTLPPHHDQMRRPSIATASQVDYRELPECIKPDLMRQLTIDQTHSGVWSSPYLLCFAKWLASVYVTMCPDAGPAHPVTMTMQRLIAVQSSPGVPPSLTIDRTHPLWVRSSQELSLVSVFSEK
jgi:hypothetical protein